MLAYYAKILSIQQLLFIFGTKNAISMARVLISSILMKQMRMAKFGLTMGLTSI